MNKGKIYAIITTNRCDLRCKYCYSGKSIGNQDMNLENSEKVCKHILKDIKTNNIEEAQIIFEGNEPLLALDIVKNIIKNLETNFKGKRIDFTIFSNLQSMNYKTLEYIKKNNIYIHTSLDGYKELHDSYRGEGSFEKTVFWIKELIKNGIPLNASTTICSESLKKYKELVDIYLSLGLKNINLRYLHRLGLGKSNWNTLGYEPKDYLTFYKKVLDYILKLNLRGIQIMEQKALFIFNKIKNNQEKICFYSPPCTGIKKQLLYDPFGDIYTCDEGRNNPDFYMIGNVSTGINPEKSKKFFDTVNRIYKNCDGCPISEYCGPCLALNSPINKNCVERCIVTRELFSYIKNLIKNEEILFIFKKNSRIIKNV